MPALNQRIISGLFFITMEKTFKISKQQITYLCELLGANERFFKENFPEAFEVESKEDKLKKVIKYYLKDYHDNLFFLPLDDDSLESIFNTITDRLLLNGSIK